MVAMPLTTPEKAGIGIAVYGAVLSTVNSVIQLLNHRMDKANVLVTVRRNMVSTFDMNVQYTIITAVNRGKRPVRITGFGAWLVDTTVRIVITDVRPPEPLTLNEGETMSAWMPESAMKEVEVETFTVSDSVGREHAAHIVPWHRRILSRHRRRRMWKQQRR
jgi:hypothetical protein